MSRWRLAATAMAVAASHAPIQAQSLNQVLKLAAGYVSEFRKQLAGIVAEETCRQEIVNTGRIGSGSNQANPVRTLRTDLLLVKPSDADRHVELRDVFEVDGKPVGGRRLRVEQMLRDPNADEYSERERPTIIKAPGGEDRPAHGRFWINPSNGSVLISELSIDSGGVIATVTTSYQSEPMMGFMVPVEMRESYLRASERITGHAQYGKFRPIAGR